MIVIGFVALMSFPFLGIGLYEAYENRKKINDFIQTTGTVVSNTYATTSHDGTLSGAYYPVVEFTQADGTLVRFSDGIGSLPADYSVGTQVAIAYNPQNPQDARIYTWKRIWFVPALFIAIGLLPPVIALVIIRAVKRAFKART